LSGLSERIKAIVEDRFNRAPCPGCGEAFWEIGNMQMLDRTLNMLNLRIIRCASCGYTSEW
jgi:RNase P subunit RPR2